MSKLISRNNNIIKYKAPSQKIEPLIRLTDDDLMLMGWQRLYYDNNPNHHQVKDSDPLRKTLNADESDWQLVYLKQINPDLTERWKIN